MGCRVRLVLSRLYSAKVLYILKFGFKVSNDEAEYKALIINLKLAKDMGAERVWVLFKSMLIVQQVRGEHKTEGKNMMRYLELVKGLLIEFPSCVIDKILRTENVQAKMLSKFTSITMPEPNPDDS